MNPYREPFLLPGHNDTCQDEILQQRVALLLSSSHPVTHGAWHRLPNFVEVVGRRHFFTVFNSYCTPLVRLEDFSSDLQNRCHKTYQPFSMMQLRERSLCLLGPRSRSPRCLRRKPEYLLRHSPSLLFLFFGSGRATYLGFPLMCWSGQNNF